MSPAETIKQVGFHMLRIVLDDGIMQNVWHTPEVANFLSFLVSIVAKDTPERI
jgi:hypothetical protein